MVAVMLGLWGDVVGIEEMTKIHVMNGSIQSGCIMFFIGPLFYTYFIALNIFWHSLKKPIKYKILIDLFLYLTHLDMSQYKCTHLRYQFYISMSDYMLTVLTIRSWMVNDFNLNVDTL